MRRPRVLFLTIAAGLMTGYLIIASVLGTPTDYAAAQCGSAPGADRPFAFRLAQAVGFAKDEGDWGVIGPRLCTIKPPVVASRLSPSDADVAPFIRPIDPAAAPRDQGCIFANARLQDALGQSREWSAQTAHTEVFAMMAAGIASGDIRFFGEASVRTPAGFQYTVGTCADVPAADAVKQSHDQLIAHFDAFVRASARFVGCEPGASLMHPRWADVYTGLGLAKPANAWLGFEVFVLAYGTGAYEGASLTERGTPRPPYCVFDPIRL